MAIETDKVIQLFEALLEDKEPYLEYTNNNSACRHRITIEGDDNLFGEESGSRIELIDDKIDRTFYLEFKGLRFLLEQSNYNELHQQFFVVFYQQKNSLIIDKKLIEEFDEIHKKVLHGNDEVEEEAPDGMFSNEFYEHIRRMSGEINRHREVVPLTAGSTPNYPDYIYATSKQSAIEETLRNMRSNIDNEKKQQNKISDLFQSMWTPNLK